MGQPSATGDTLALRVHSFFFHFLTEYPEKAENPEYPEKAEYPEKSECQDLTSFLDFPDIPDLI